MRFRVALPTAALLLSFIILGRVSAEPAAGDPAATAGQPKVRTVAIFVKNRAKNVDDEKVTVLEDFITSQITDQGFHVLSREDVVNSVAAFAAAGPNVGDANEPGAKLDKILSNNTSALRLAQNMNVDYLLVASITTYGQDVTDFAEGDVRAKITESTMQVSYKLLDGVEGGSLTGDVITATIKDQEQPGLAIKRDLVNKLLKQASTKLSNVLGAKVAADKIRSAPAGAKMGEFAIDPSMTDLAIPEVTKSDAGEYQITANHYRIEVMSCTVALDGVVVGTTPGPFPAAPGLHKIRLSREGFKDWEQTINVRDGLRLNVAMQLTPDGYARWRDNIDFLQSMKDKAKYGDADVKRIEGMAKMFSQSGFLVENRQKHDSDIKSDVKIKGKSLWPEAPAPQPGPAGRDGRDGVNGRDGRDGVDVKPPKPDAN